MTAWGRRRCRSCYWLALAIVGAAALASGRLTAQEPSSSGAVESLETIEARLGERYARLEVLASRLAELSDATQPRRAELLRQLVSSGRQRNVPGQFAEIAAALADGSYSTAIDGQTRLQADLEKLLELLLQEDRDRQLDAQRKRVLRYLQDLNRLIRQQRGVAARTEGGDEAAQLSADQRRVQQGAEELQQAIENDESTANATPPESEQQGGSAEAPASDGSAEASPGEAGDSSEGASPSDSSSGPPEAAPLSDGAAPQPAEGAPSSGSPSQDGGSAGDGGAGAPPEDSPSSGPQQSPMQRAADRLRRAQQRMEDAQRRLEEAQRQGAVDQQRQAVEELELAKAELERILRQLREEELERMLVMLEARFKKMLDEQVAVYEATQRLEDSQTQAPAHEVEIAAGRLSRREATLVREADRALVLLREDGTSVAFPEAVEQVRDEMQRIAERLAGVKLDMITQGMEEDVIAALEELLAAVRQQLDQVRDQRAQQQAGGGAPGEQPLVDQLAELRMIRALQIRVNRRTQQVGAMIEGEQARDPELRELLAELALRQAKIVEAARDLESGANR